MTIANILATYGFETRSNHTMWWGCGSLVSGCTADVTPLGNDLYEVKYHEWYYDSWGECRKNENEKIVLHGALLLQNLFERLPIFYYYRPRRR